MTMMIFCSIHSAIERNGVKKPSKKFVANCSINAIRSFCKKLQNMVVKGGIAQLVERCPCKADVSGSSPLTSTTF